MSPEEQKFWDEFNLLLKPEIPIELEYRLHYNSNGDIVQCSMIDHPDSDQYIIVNQETYNNYFRYRVVNGSLKEIVHTTEYHARLKKSNRGFKVVKNHAALILEQDEKYTDIEYYERTNH